MNRARKLLVPPILACAVLAALAFAATAAAEIRVGEATGPVNPAVNPQANVTAAKAEYNSDTGALTFAVTTVAAPWPGTEAEPSELEMAAGLGKPSVCSYSGLGTAAFPVFGFQYHYLQPEIAIWTLQESSSAEPKFPETAGQATLSISGTTTTFTATAPKAADLPFNCAIAYVHIGGNRQGDPLVFPIAVPPPPPPASPTPPSTQPKTSTPAPAALAIARSKPLKLKPGKWTKVRVKVANGGGSSTAPGSLRLKAPRGVLVKPEKQKLPVLTAGGTWTVSAKVQLTAKARQKSTVSLTAAAGRLTAKGSLVLKRQG